MRCIIRGITDEVIRVVKKKPTLYPTKFRIRSVIIARVVNSISFNIIIGVRTSRRKVKIPQESIIATIEREGIFAIFVCEGLDRKSVV